MEYSYKPNILHGVMSWTEFNHKMSRRYSPTGNDSYSVYFDRPFSKSTVLYVLSTGSWCQLNSPPYFKSDKISVYKLYHFHFSFNNSYEILNEITISISCRRLYVAQMRLRLSMSCNIQHPCFSRGIHISCINTTTFGSYVVRWNA